MYVKEALQVNQPEVDTLYGITETPEMLMTTLQNNNVCLGLHIHSLE